MAENFVEDEFDVVVAILAEPPGDADALVGGFDLAAGILEGAPAAEAAPQTLGFVRGGPAHMAYQRKCKELKRTDAKKEKLEEELNNMKQRLTAQCKTRRVSERTHQ